jgi:hypothetical protein
MRFRLATLFCVLLTMVGCGERRAWHFDGKLLTPPRPAAADGSFRLKHARAGGMACRLEQPGIRLELRGRTASVRADAGALAPRPGVMLTGIGGGARPSLAGDVVAPVDWFRATLRPWLAAQESTGCLRTGESEPLAARIIDQMTLPPATAYRLRYGEYILDGFLDLSSRFRLKLVEPIREKGVAVGYQTFDYPLVAAPDGGVRVTVGGAEFNRAGQVTRGVARDRALLHLPAEATRLRYFFRSWSISQDRRIALIAAPSVGALDEATRAFEANPELWCAQHSCVDVPKDAVIGPEIQVTANGAPAWVPVGGTLGELLKWSQDMKSVRVLRPYEGRLVPVEFDPADRGILSLVLIGGEQITW